MIIDRGDNSFSWSCVKFSHHAVMVGAGSTESSDLDIDGCLSIEYQPRDRVLRFEIQQVRLFLVTNSTHARQESKSQNTNLSSAVSH